MSWPHSLPSLPTFHEDPGDPGGPLPAIDDAEVVALVLRPQRQELDAVVAVEPDARHPSVAPRTLLEELQAPLVPEADHLVRKRDLFHRRASFLRFWRPGLSSSKFVPFSPPTASTPSRRSTRRTSATDAAAAAPQTSCHLRNRSKTNRRSR